jgi:beta-phosphoglucomutase
MLDWGEHNIVRMVKGIAFDLEGTVVDVEPAHHYGHIAAAADVGVELTIDSAFAKLPHFIGGPDSAICEEIWELSDKSRPLSFVIERDKWHYHRLLKELTVVPRTGFLVLLEELKKRGIRTSIGSLTERIEAATLLERSGVGALFPREVTVLREDVVNVKPAPDVFLETARRMGIDPSEQLVFEDSPRGVAAALAAGSRAIGMPVYNRPEALDPLRKAGVEKIFMSWDEIDIGELL